MIGLLYKDFLCVRGKLVSFLMLAQLLLLTVLRFTFRNNVEMDLLIYVFYTLSCGILLCYILFFLDSALLKMESKVQERRYFVSLPISKKQYVQEKYVFFLVAVYACVSFGFLEGMVCSVFCADTKTALNTFSTVQLMSAFQLMLPLMASIILFNAAIEFVFMFIFGAKRGVQTKTGVVIFLFLLFIMYMLFGNLELLDKWNQETLYNYLQSHAEISLWFNILPVLIGLGSYLLSYFISVKSFENREDWLND